MYTPFIKLSSIIDNIDSKFHITNGGLVFVYEPPNNPFAVIKKYNSKRKESYYILGRFICYEKTLMSILSKIDESEFIYLLENKNA